MGEIKRRPCPAILLVRLFMAIALLLATVTTAAACKETNLSSPNSTDEGNPKMDSQLNQLISAETQGEAVSFAEQHGIELVDGNVRVIIECVPGQLEAATEAATNAGAELETSYDNLLQVVVPITKLNTLADAASVHFIRLPQQPLPAPNNLG